MLESLSQWISDTVSTFLGPINSFLNSYVLNWPPQAPLFAILLLGTGLYVTLRFGFVQLRGGRSSAANQASWTRSSASASLATRARARRRRNCPCRAHSRAFEPSITSPMMAYAVQCRGPRTRFKN